MFTELTAILRKGDTLAFTVARENDTQLRVNVMPKLFTLDGENGEDRKALNQPLSIVATPAELDSAEFTATLNRFTESTNGLRHTIDDVEAAHKAAKESKAKKPEPKAPEKKSEDKPKAKEEPEEEATAEEKTETLI